MFGRCCGIAFWSKPVVAALLLLVTMGSFAYGGRTSHLALNTVGLSTAVMAFSVPVGCALALLLARTDVGGRRLVGGLLAGVLFLPLFVQAGAWQAALGGDGWCSSLLGFSLVEGWRGAIWIHSAAAVPWVVLIAGSGLSSVERPLEEAALLDGSPWQVAVLVTLRCSASAIGVAAVWVALVTAGEMAVTDFFQVRTFAEELYTAFALGDIQPLGRAGSLSSYDPDPGVLGMSGVWTGMAVTAAMLAAALLFVTGLVPLARGGSAKSTLVFHLGNWRWFGSATLLIVTGLVVILPLASLVWKSGIEVVETSKGRVRQWSASKCADMVVLNSRIEGGRLKLRHQKELGWSLAVDSAAATASLLLALPVAWFARRGGWRSWVGLASVMWPWAVPGPVIGLGLIALMNRPGVPGLTYLYDRTICPLVLGCVAHSLPLATLVLWPSLRALPNELLESAALEGANLWQRWWNVVLPMRWPVFVAAWILAFVWSLGELDASVLVAPPGITPLSNHIFGLLHFGAQDQVAGLCLAVFLAVQIATLGSWRLLRKTG
jgi:iron(III) transport system permease protein